MPGALAATAKTRAPTCDPSMWMEPRTAWGLPLADQSPQTRFLAKMAGAPRPFASQLQKPVAPTAPSSHKPALTHREGRRAHPGWGVGHALTFAAVLLSHHKAPLEGRPPEQVTFKENPEEVRKQAEQRASKGGNRSGKL